MTEDRGLAYAIFIAFLACFAWGLLGVFYSFDKSNNATMKVNAMYVYNPLYWLIKLGSIVKKYLDIHYSDDEII